MSENPEYALYAFLTFEDIQQLQKVSEPTR